MIALTLVPVFAVAYFTVRDSFLSHLVIVVGVYLVIAPRSLREHATAVSDALYAGSTADARFQLSRLVSRDTQSLDEQAISAACCESVLENGSDSIFAALFWFCIPSIIAHGNYEAINTLDAMWGYKNNRYLYFGWAVARTDDALNYCPARLVAFSYAILGNTRRAFHCWFTQAPLWKSPNAGPVMAAGAGSLNIVLGGSAMYDGNDQSRPTLGAGAPARPEDIERSLALVQRTLIMWLTIFVALDWALAS
ncbi:UNVERIFIED_CONTAM: hypothetical protein GTU68_034910 [Idotea baltica]|nr:hypothetical protein [Idotea baltica]